MSDATHAPPCLSALQQQFLDHFAHSSDVDAAMTAASIKLQILHQWQSESPEFRTEWASALDRAHDYLALRLIAQAQSGITTVEEVETDGDRRRKTTTRHDPVLALRLIDRHRRHQTDGGSAEQSTDMALFIDDPAGDAALITRAHIRADAIATAANAPPTGAEERTESRDEQP